MFRRLIERFKNVFVCSNNLHTHGNQVLDVDVSSIRSISRAENKKLSKKLTKLHDMLLVEGMGGIMTPILKNYYITNLIKEMKIPIIKLNQQKLTI